MSIFKKKEKHKGQKQNKGFPDEKTDCSSSDVLINKPIIIDEEHSHKIEIILARISPEHLVEYKKISDKFTHLQDILRVFNGNEIGKDYERKDLKRHLIIILYSLLVIFNLTAIIIFIFLARKGNINDLILLFKWFLVVTLGEIIAMVFFIVRFLFNDNIKMYEQIKNIISNE